MQLPPLNAFLIEDLLATRDVAVHLGAFRHQAAVDPAPVARVLRRLSELACELPDVLSLDVNPLRVDANGAVAMDVQVVLERRAATRRYAHLAIHPYPWQWMRETSLKGDRSVLLRPIRPEDGQGLGDLVRNMSAESRYFRFMHAINELSPQMVAQFTKLDYDRQMAFVAVDDQTIVGVSRYAMDGERREGEFAVSVADDWQGVGLASALMRLLIEHATAQGLAFLRGRRAALEQADAAPDGEARVRLPDRSRRARRADLHALARTGGARRDGAPLGVVRRFTAGRFAVIGNASPRPRIACRSPMSCDRLSRRPLPGRHDRSRKHAGTHRVAENAWTY